MRRTIVLGLALGLAASLALPAYANWDAKIKAVCTDVNNDNVDKPKLFRDKFANDDVVRACLLAKGISPDDANVAAHALVFDQDTPPNGVLRVLQRCDTTVICTLSTTGAIASAGTSTPKKQRSKSVVIFHLVDVGPLNEGSMICKQSESFSPVSGKFSFKNSCTGVLDVDGMPCTFKLKTGKLFKETGPCP